MQFSNGQEVLFIDYSGAKYACLALPVLRDVITLVFSQNGHKAPPKSLGHLRLRLLPAVRAVDGGFNAVGCGAFCERFQSGWRLSSCKRRCPKDFGGALWPFRKEIEAITSLKIGSAGQACFESPQSMKRDFQPSKKRTAVNLLKSQAQIKRKVIGRKRV